MPHRRHPRQRVPGGLRAGEPAAGADGLGAPQGEGGDERLGFLAAVRQVVVVLTLINNESLAPDDFVVWRDACNLTDAGRKAFFAAYELRKATIISHPVYEYRMSYARMLEVQARMRAAFVRGEIPTYTGFMVR